MTIKAVFISEDSAGCCVNLVSENKDGLFQASKVVCLKPFDKGSVAKAIADYQAELDLKDSRQAELDSFVGGK